MIYTVEFFF